MKEDDFKSGDRRDGGRPASGRRDDARPNTNSAPRPHRDDRPGDSTSRSYGADRRADGDRPRRDDNAGTRPFNREGSVDRRNDGAPRSPFNREGGSGDRRSDDRPSFDRNRSGGNSERPYRPGTPRFGNANSAPRPQTDRREEYPKPKFGRDNSRWDNKGSNQRPPYSPDRRDDRPRDNTDRNTDHSTPRDRAGEPSEPRTPRFDRDTDRRNTEPRDNRDSDRRDDYSQPTDRIREERPRADNESRQRSGENRFGQERRYAERPTPNRSTDARDSTPRDTDRPRDDNRPYADRRNDERNERRPPSREDSPRPTRSYDNDRPRAADRDERPRSFDRDDRPRSDDRPERPARRFDNPASGSDRPRPYSGTPPNRPTGDRRNDRNERPAPRSDERRSGPSSDERRVGKYDRAPTYNQDAMRNGIPRKKREEIERAEKHDNRNTEPGTIRLNRYIANAGICSRREADELIAQGTVQVNGKVVTEMGHKVQPGDVVKYGSRILNPEKMVYVLLNKPKDYITTTEDPEERRTVMELVADAGPFRIYPVGRLDRNTTGLMLMTNDGELAEKLTHPSNEIKKIYQVELDKPISDEHFETIQAGFDLEDGRIKPDGLSIITPDAQVVGIEIHSGRNRIVRRIFENFGYEVTKLDRTSYAGLTKKELPRGKWRFLEPKEVIKLKYLQ